MVFSGGGIFRPVSCATAQLHALVKGSRVGLNPPLQYLCKLGNVSFAFIRASETAHIQKTRKSPGET
jgi:hypothetical protein